MKTFKNKKEGFKHMQKEMLTRAVPLSVLALIVGFGISYANQGQLDTLPFAILIGIGAVGFGLFKGLNRQRQLFESYVLTIDDEFIHREQLNTPTVRIKKAHVTQITASPQGTITIKGINKQDVIVITNQIDDYPTLQRSLSEIKAITAAPAKTAIEKLSLPVVILTLALMAIVYISTNKPLVLTSGIVLTIILAWSFYEMQTSKNIDDKTKRSSWWTLAVIATVVVIMYTKLIG